MTRTILTTASGRPVDLLNPTPADVDFMVLAEHLAKEARYNGATPGVVYSVAEHLVRGALAVIADTGNETAAAYFLLHDVPEAVLKDDTTPKKRAIAAIAEAEFGVLAGTIVAAFDRLTERWDKAAAGAAGLAWPAPADIAAIVHHYDRVMLVTEWRDLMRAPNASAPFAMPGRPDVQPLDGRIVPWPWQFAMEELREAFCAHLPSVIRENPGRAYVKQVAPLVLGRRAGSEKVRAWLTFKELCSLADQPPAQINTLRKRGLLPISQLSSGSRRSRDRYSFIDALLVILALRLGGQVSRSRASEIAGGLRSFAETWLAGPAADDALVGCIGRLEGRMDPFWGTMADLRPRIMDGRDLLDIVLVDVGPAAKALHERAAA